MHDGRLDIGQHRAFGLGLCQRLRAGRHFLVLGQVLELLGYSRPGTRRRGYARQTERPHEVRSENLRIHADERQALLSKRADLVHLVEDGGQVRGADDAELVEQVTRERSIDPFGHTRQIDRITELLNRGLLDFVGRFKCRIRRVLRLLRELKIT